MGHGFSHDDSRGDLQGKAQVTPCFRRFTMLLSRDIERMMLKFEESGRPFALHVDQFCAIVQVPDHDARECFQVFDRERNGLLDAFELLATIGLISSMDLDQKILFLFRVFDFGKRGCLTMDETVILLHSAVKGVSKLLDKRLVVPREQDVERLVKRIFSRMGKTIDDEIDASGFKKACFEYNEVLQIIRFIDGAAGLAPLHEGEMFVDEEFSDMAQVLYGAENTDDLLFGEPALFSWKRGPHDGFVNVPDDCSISRVCQGYFCSSAVADALSMLSTRRRALQKLFITTGQEASGRYTMQFFYRGEWTLVTVDNRVVHSQASFCPSCGQLDLEHVGFLHSVDDTAQMWGPLIEKGLAKLLGSYATLYRCTLMDVLEILTAGAAMILAVSGLDQDSLFQMTRQATNTGVVAAFRVLASGANPYRNAERQARKGVASGVAYVIQSVKPGFIQVVAPVDEKKNRYKKEQSPENDDSITLWMPMEDFTRVFTDMVWCKIFEVESWVVQTRRSYVTLWGDLLATSWYKNEQYCLEVAQNGTSLSISVFLDLDVVSMKDPDGVVFALVKHDFGDARNKVATPLTIIAKDAVKGLSTLDRNKHSSSLHVQVDQGKYAIILLGEERDEKVWCTLVVRTLQREHGQERNSHLFGGPDVDWLDLREARDSAMASIGSDRANKEELGSFGNEVELHPICRGRQVDPKLQLQNHLHALVVERVERDLLAATCK